jgi:hypothetical protein
MPTDETKQTLLDCERSIYASDCAISAVNKNNDFDWLIKRKRVLILILSKSYKRLLPELFFVQTIVSNK